MMHNVITKRIYYEWNNEGPLRTMTAKDSRWLRQREGYSSSPILPIGRLARMRKTSPVTVTWAGGS